MTVYERLVQRTPLFVILPNEIMSFVARGLTADVSHPGDARKTFSPRAHFLPRRRRHQRILSHGVFDIYFGVGS